MSAISASSLDGSARTSTQLSDDILLPAETVKIRTEKPAAQQFRLTHQPAIPALTLSRHRPAHGRTYSSYPRFAARM
jgi:hypothetical protein